MVNHIITGGSADRNGIVQVGDIVVSLDSKDVRGKVHLHLPPSVLNLKSADSVLFQTLAELRSSFVGLEGRLRRMNHQYNLVRLSAFMFLTLRHLNYNPRAQTCIFISHIRLPRVSVTLLRYLTKLSA